MLSRIAGFFSSRSSISRRARSETWLATLRNRFSTYSRSSSLTGVLRPLTSICMETLSSVDAAFTEGTPRFGLSQRSCVGERRYLQRTVFIQLARTRPQCRARRVDVVDQDRGARHSAGDGELDAARGEPLRPAGGAPGRGGGPPPPARHGRR